MKEQSTDMDADFLKEEIRCDYLVTSKRKKVWAAELRILERFDEVCRKYDLKYYAYYGTLLGAVRHQGFIPWDDDIDVAMFRDDYEKLRSVASSEFTEPYFFQDAYTDRIVWPFAKVRDSRTTAVEARFRDLEGVHQGMFIDIFPLDSVFDGINEQFPAIEAVQRLLWYTVIDPRMVLKELKAGKALILDQEFLLQHMKKDITERYQLFEQFTASHFGETKNVNYILCEIFHYGNYKSVERSWFEETVYLPFENIRIPAPAEYDKILTRNYGDYHQFVRGSSDHEGIILEPDIPYKEYLRKYM